jgi:hypothetical protein
LTTTAAGYFERRGYVRVERHALPGPIRRSEEFTQLCPASAVAMASPVIAAGTVPSRPFFNDTATTEIYTGPEAARCRHR